MCIRLQAAWLADGLRLASRGPALLVTLPRQQPTAEQRRGAWQTVPRWAPLPVDLLTVLAGSLAPAARPASSSVTFHGL